MPPASNDTEFVELTSPSEWRDAFAVMHELRVDLTQDGYRELLGEMTGQGYRMFALRQSDRILALAGTAVITNLYYGRHLWIYDLVTRSDERSRGHGARLLDHLEDLARAESCRSVALSSGMQRTGAHRFYERQGYERPSFVFKKELR